MDRRTVFSSALILLVVASLLFFHHFSETKELNGDEVIEDRKEVDDREGIERTRITMREGSDLKELVSELNTSDRLLEYLNKNLTVVQEPIDEWIAKHPEQLISDEKGNRVDVMVFSAFVLQENNHESVILRYRFEGKDDDETGENIVVVFRDTDVPKYIFTDNSGVRMRHHGWSFDEMFSEEEERLDVEITQYANFLPRYLELKVEFDRPEWWER